MAALMAQFGLLSNVASGVPQALLGAAAVSTVLCLEVPRRVGGIQVEALGLRKCIRSCGTILVGCAPEVVGLSVVLFLAMLLRLRGDTDVMANPMEQQVWEQIKVEWPILMGADTLLNLQAMLRLLVLLFLAMRAQVGGRSPLSGLPALLFLAAALTRGRMGCVTDAYRLEGPLALGGDLPIACEVAGVAFWTALGHSALRKAPVAATVMVGGAIWFASHHYLNLAKNATADQLFIQAHVLELLAAFAYVSRAICLAVGRNDEGGNDQDSDHGPSKGDWRSNAFIGFMHMVMTVQQAFSAYYFLTAFEPHPSLVAVGRPFCVLCIANLLQLGAYLCAAAFWAGSFVFQPEAAQPEQDVDTTPDTTVIQDKVPQDESGPTVTEMEDSSAEDLDFQLLVPELEEDLLKAPSGAPCQSESM